MLDSLPNLQERIAKLILAHTVLLILVQIRPGLKELYSLGVHPLQYRQARLAVADQHR
jgi:hypothetical protein